MRHQGTNGKMMETWREPLVDLDERTVKTMATIGEYVSMGERLVLRVYLN
jgi:hypothetical protein